MSRNVLDDVRSRKKIRVVIVSMSTEVLSSSFFLQTDAVGKPLGEMTYTYTNMHSILYALGVGMSTKQDDHLKFLYEGHEEFSCLPTFGVIPAQSSMLDGGLSSVPGINFDLTRVSKIVCVYQLRLDLFVWCVCLISGILWTFCRSSCTESSTWRSSNLYPLQVRLVSAKLLNKSLVLLSG